MYPFLVNYTAAQAAFIEKLASHMEKSPSEVVTSIIVPAREIMDAEGEEARDDLVAAMTEEPRAAGATYRQETLALPKEEYEYIAALAKAAGSSYSCAVRHVVAFFLDSVEEVEKDMDKDGETVEEN